MSRLNFYILSGSLYLALIALGYVSIGLALAVVIGLAISLAAINLVIAEEG